MSSPLRPIKTCMEKYILYETAAFYYIVGCDALETYFRILKLNRSILKPKSLDEVLTEDPLVYNKDDLGVVLEMIHEGNKNTGGLTRTTIAYGLVGFVRFLDCYYFTLITKKTKVGCVGSNFIYAIKSAEVFAIRPREDNSGELSFARMWRTVNKKLSKTNTDQAESRYMGLFQFIDISKDFFFSYTYDLTHSLQHNYMMSSSNAFPPPPFKEMYEWNKFQTDEIRSCLGDVTASLWTLPIIHGSFQQRRFSLFGRVIDLVLIARRSRHYAGTRYLKRGVSVHGKVANDCEMEQIIQLDTGSQTTFSSYVQMRGSIPTYWYQETSVTNPKPPILVDRIDPNYLATQEHFADLIRRYSLPIIVLDLVKHNERRKRECIVGRDFRQAIEVINMNISPDQQIRYIALDFSRMSKNKGPTGGKDAKGAATGKEWSRIESSLGKEVEQNMRRESGNDSKDSSKKNNSNNTSGGNTTNDNDDNSDNEDGQVGRIDILRELEDISSWSLQETGIFSSTVRHIGQLNILQKSHLERGVEKGYLEQKGVLRTNCIDCLDRTNVAQFAMGVRFLALGLRALGVLDNHTLDPSNAMLLGLMDMFSEMGDRIALQYGGSEAHKKVSKGSGKTKHGEFLTSIKRYYSNSFTDRVKQDAMNLFLGYFQPSLHDFNLWDIETDYFLHNRLLHPPRPDVDRILLSYNGPRHHLLLTDDPNKNNTNNNIDNNNDKQKEYDWNTVLKKYFIRSPTITPEILQKIIKKEDIKERLKLKQLDVLEAEELWWKQALFDFDNSTMWMCLPPLKETVVMSYYDTIHCPDKLTSFDYELSQEFQYPYDATIFASTIKNESNGTLWNRKKNKKIMNGSNEDADNEVNEDDEDRTESIENVQRDQVEFDLLSLARSIGTRARTLVGDLLLPNESETQSNRFNKDSFKEEKKSEINTLSFHRQWSNSNTISSPLTKQTSNYEQTALRKYTRYCEDGIHPEVYITEKSSSSTQDFLKALENFTVDVNNVKEMERLSLESYVHDTIVSGQYRGMHKTDSAKMVTSTIFSSIVFIEPTLQDCLEGRQESKDEDSNNNNFLNNTGGSPNHNNSTDQSSFLASRSKIVSSNSLTIEIPLKAKNQIENIITNNPSSENDPENNYLINLEEDIFNYSNKYLYDQLIYSHEINITRLETYLSSLTSEHDLISYIILMYCNEVISYDNKIIKYILNKRSTIKTLTNIYHELNLLDDINNNINKIKDMLNKQFYENEVTESIEVYFHKLNENLNKNKAEYTNFTQIGTDLFSKTINPHFLCNERTVKSYEAYKDAKINK